MDPSQTSFFQLLSVGTMMVGPGASEIGLDLTAVVLLDGARIFLFSVVRLEVGTFHLASNTDALHWSGCLGQTSMHQRGCPALERIARGPLDHSFRFHEWCS